ncbi:MAG: 2,3-diketo-5-methylthio-phosphopentane phosphatase [Candidatus Eremiobacteraeota bacterium]|nr:2,3-diketo-5-methylthio-phosphopentane phosphatase [Candidatus Eremiobacteraeota bacterium]
MEFILDWDGTVTKLDPLDAGLAAGTITHREVMEREFLLLTVPLADVVAFLVENVRVRRGFAAFVERFDPLILSSSFHETIEPILAREGVTARVRANRVDPRPDGWRIRWVADSDCATCGEPCKRASLPAGALTYVGDGYSDRCAALAADRVFARDGLARYLDGEQRRYEPFTDFSQLTAALALREA